MTTAMDSAHATRRPSRAAPLACFAADIRRDLLDREPFTFRHRLLGHPALSLANLGRAIPALPASQVFYSSGRLQRGDDFDRAHVDHANGLSIEETIETIRTSDSYIMVRAAETDVSFQSLFRELVSDVQELMRERGVGGVAHGATLYLFIASPGSITPFHIDRYATILLQFQGSKEVTVFPAWDDRVVPTAVREGFVAHSGLRPTWDPRAEGLGITFRFAPGDALHIPFVAGHHVRNGPGEVSISMSVIFNTDETRRITHAMVLNEHLRRLHLSPAAAGRNAWRDGAKAALWQAGSGLARRLR